MIAHAARFSVGGCEAVAKKPAPKASKGKTAKKKVAASAAPRRRPVKRDAAPHKPGRDHSPAKGRAVRAAPKAAKQKRATGSAAASKRPAPKRSAVVSVPQVQPVDTLPESPLTREEIEQFRGMLLEKRAAILGDVTTLRNEALNKDRRDAAGDLSSMPIHMADLGSDNYELEFTLGLIEGERAILKEVEEALERIRRSTYGICLATGKPIGKARLKAKPWAKYCYEYALAQEQGQTRRF